MSFFSIIKYKVYRYLHFWNYNKSDWLDYWVRKKLNNNKAFVIQVGANDGTSNDPIYNYISKYNWKGILIEPQKIAFTKLKSAYINNENILCLEKAIITEQKDETKLYCIENPQHDWHKLVNTTNPDKGVIKHLRDQETIIEEKVKATTFNNLLDEYKVDKIDLLQIDVEGMEFDLLMSFPFEQIKPKIINFEHRHLSFAEFNELYQYLSSLNYKFYIGKHDTLALNKDSK